MSLVSEIIEVLMEDIPEDFFLPIRIERLQWLLPHLTIQGN